MITRGARNVGKSDPGGVVRALIVSGGPEKIDEGALGDAADVGAKAGGHSYRERVDGFERALLSEALSACDGNQSDAARRLSISRVTMLDRMKRLGVR